jgi:hypothetical protein
MSGPLRCLSERRFQRECRALIALYQDLEHPRNCTSNDGRILVALPLAEKIVKDTHLALT